MNITETYLFPVLANLISHITLIVSSGNELEGLIQFVTNSFPPPPATLT